MCLEPLEHFWQEEDQAFHWKDAVRVDKQQLCHPVCSEDYKKVETPAVVDGKTPQCPDLITNPIGYLDRLKKISATSRRPETDDTFQQTQREVFVDKSSVSPAPSESMPKYLTPGSLFHTQTQESVALPGLEKSVVTNQDDQQPAHDDQYTGV